MGILDFIQNIKTPLIYININKYYFDYRYRKRNLWCGDSNVFLFFLLVQLNYQPEQIKDKLHVQPNNVKIPVFVMSLKNLS